MTQAMTTRTMWAVLVSWGVAVLLLAGLFAWRLQRQQREQDRAMCVTLDLIVKGPEPVAGPAGERSRAVRAAILAYRATLGCD
jgi:hypothetical protein